MLYGAGTVWTAAAHIITAVIGSGVLSLAWAMAQLGWVAGPVILLLFAAITYYTCCLLSDCYRVGDPETGKRNYTYTEAVESYLGTYLQIQDVNMQIRQRHSANQPLLTSHSDMDVTLTLQELHSCLLSMCRRGVRLFLRRLPVCQHVRHRHRLHHHSVRQRRVGPWTGLVLIDQPNQI